MRKRAHGGIQAVLALSGLSDKTVDAYVWVAAFFLDKYSEVSAETLAEYRAWLAENFEPSTAERRVRLINSYVAFLGLDELKLVDVSSRKRRHPDNTISLAEYRRLMKHLHDGEHWRDYHAVHLLATTGMRVSELSGMGVADVREGCLEVETRGVAHHVYIPEAVAKDVLSWAEGEGRTQGPLLVNRFDRTLGRRGFADQLKARALECDIDERAARPQAFRNLFAQCFLSAGGDGSLLDVLMGNAVAEECVWDDPARIRKVVCRLVTW